MAAQQKEPRRSKRMTAVRAKVDRSKVYPVDEALHLVTIRDDEALLACHRRGRVYPIRP